MPRYKPLHNARGARRRDRAPEKPKWWVHLGLLAGLGFLGAVIAAGLVALAPYIEDTDYQHRRPRNLRDSERVARQEEYLEDQGLDISRRTRLGAGIGAGLGAGIAVVIAAGDWRRWKRYQKARPGPWPKR